MFSNKIMPKLCSNFYCENCDYGTSKKSSYDNHITSAKHTKSMVSNEILPKLCSEYICDKCSKKYKDNSGLWRHKKKCNNTEISNNNQITPELIMSVLQQNTELQQIIIEQNKQMIEMSKNTGTYNTTHTNSHNKAFNLNFFLNETCKDAMNIMDFVDSIKLQLCDLENVGKLGFVDGISKIIVQNLNSLDENMRPVHCIDTKREVMYVKDDNKWEKENEDKQKLRKVIKHVTHKNSKLFKEFKTKYPGCEKSDSRYSDKYDKLIIEAMGGKGDNDLEKEDKIIKNIAKVVVIDKEII